VREKEDGGERREEKEKSLHMKAKGTKRLGYFRGSLPLQSAEIGRETGVGRGELGVNGHLGLQGGKENSKNQSAQDVTGKDKRVQGGDMGERWDRTAN